MKWYMGVVMRIIRTIEKTSINSFAYIAQARSSEEADGIGLRIGRQQWPEDSEVKVSCELISPETLAAIRANEVTP